MAVYKDEERKTWYVRMRYKDEDGKSREVKKRGFATKREAEKWEKANRKSDPIESANSDMLFASFVELYKEYHFPRIRDSTAKIKGNIIDKYLIPFFGSFSVGKVTVSDVICFQNGLLELDDEHHLSKSYLATIHSVLSSMFNYGMKYIGLQSNPASEAGNIGSLKSNSDRFWDLEQYKKFIGQFEKGSTLYLAYEVLYWTGIRRGELLALTPGDFDFSKMSVAISKTKYTLDGETLIAPPKTESGKRVVILPDSLGREIQEYINKTGKGNSDSLFPVSSTILMNRMKAAVAKAGIEQIHIHDLRHSHVSLLIRRGFSPVAISSRLGHRGAYVVHRYAHMWPGIQKEMAGMMDELNKNR